MYSTPLARAGVLFEVQRVRVVGSDVDGDVEVFDNLNQDIAVHSNTIDGDLLCEGNTLLTATLDEFGDRLGNTVGGDKEGQCSKAAGF